MQHLLPRVTPRPPFNPHPPCAACVECNECPHAKPLFSTGLVAKFLKHIAEMYPHLASSRARLAQAEGAPLHTCAPCARRPSAPFARCSRAHASPPTRLCAAGASSRCARIKCTPLRNGSGARRVQLHLQRAQRPRTPSLRRRRAQLQLRHCPHKSACHRRQLIRWSRPSTVSSLYQVSCAARRAARAPRLLPRPPTPAGELEQCLPYVVANERRVRAVRLYNEAKVSSWRARG